MEFAPYIDGMVGVSDDLSYLDDFSHDDYVKLKKRRVEQDISLRIRKEHTLQDRKTERMVEVIDRLLKEAKTLNDIETIQSGVKVFETTTPLLDRQLSIRVAKKIARHTQRVKDGRVFVPSDLRFPLVMKNGGREALIFDSKGYKYHIRNGFAVTA